MNKTLEDRLNEAEDELKHLQQDFLKVKKELENITTKLIGARKLRDDLKTKLIEANQTEVKEEITQRDIDIKNLKEKLPELLEKV